MVGFTLGGYAILVSLSSGSLGSVLGKEPDETVTDYMRGSATFFHFIFVEIIALLVALLGKPINELSLLGMLNLHYEWLITLNELIRHTFNFVGLLLLFYAISLAFAALIAIFRLTGIVDMILHLKPEDTDGDESEKQKKCT